MRPLRPGIIRWTVQLDEPPAEELITLSLAKSHLGVTYREDDEYIEFLVRAARERVEGDAGISIGTSSRILWLDRFPRLDRIEEWPWRNHPPGAILLPIHPVQTVTKVTWYAQDGSPTEIPSTAWYLDAAFRPARLLPKNQGSWPDLSTVREMAAVKVEFVTGWADLAHTPALALECVLMALGYMFETRTPVLSGSGSGSARRTPTPLSDGLEWLIQKLSVPTVG